MNNFLVVLKKELIDIFRDKKTIIFSLLLPILIYPAMFGIMDYAMKDSQNAIQKLSVGIVDSGKSQIENVLENSGKFKTETTGDLNKELKSGKISAIIQIPDNFDTDVSNEKSTNIKIIYDETSTNSMSASDSIKAFLNTYYNEIVNQRIEKRGLDKNIITPFTVDTVSNNSKAQNDDGGISTFILGFIPTMIIIFIFVPTMAVCADLGAGEKERQTLEPLLTTSASRSAIMWGKVAATSVVGFITLIVSLIAMFMSINFVFSGAAKAVHLNILSAILIAVFSLIILITIASIEIAISIYARSTKEANSYLGGLVIVVFILAYLPYMMDAKSIKFLYFNVPITNVVCVMKEFMVGMYNITHILVVAAWVLVYIAASVVFASAMFNREKIISRT
ncbi:ABC transporter permease [Clostridium sp. 19966]|uniref:ABC transporter permease n=1 Tax=Clostridium sp. 19966 TaxID=2768166 RepID=UPI0028DEEBE8|nr:ABC transporter permease [Clostridium sp. 19966]MDT8716769.1 ABC transporter permease [Clostridium sp. 19966]